MNMKGLLLILLCLTIVAIAAYCFSTNAIRTPRHSTPDDLRRSIGEFVDRGDFSSAISLLKHTDIAREVQLARNQKDLRWMAVYEDTQVIPGLDQPTNVTVGPSDVWVVPGTSDAILHEDWQAAATDFAERYNRLLQKQK